MHTAWYNQKETLPLLLVGKKEEGGMSEGLWEAIAKKTNQLMVSEPWGLGGFYPSQ